MEAKELLVLALAGIHTPPQITLLLSVDLILFNIIGEIGNNIYESERHLCNLVSDSDGRYIPCPSEWLCE